jgi:hypothetical protein
VQSIDTVLTQIANEDAVPYIIAEIPTNPSWSAKSYRFKKCFKSRTQNGCRHIAIDPVFILDQTFCPICSLLGEEDILQLLEQFHLLVGQNS